MFIEFIHETLWNFVESIAASLTKRVEDLVGKVSDLKQVLNSARRILKTTKHINLIDTNLH